VDICFPGGLRVEALHQGFWIRTDQAIAQGGGGKAPSPFDLFLASIGTCSGFYALRFCQQRSLRTDGLALTLTAERDSERKKVVRVRLEVSLPIDFPEKYRTAIVHAVGIAFAATVFVLLLVTNGSDKVGIGLYLVLLAWSLGAAAATGSFGGVVITMALALVAMVHGIWGAAIASGVRDAGQAYIAIFYVPPLLVPVLATAAFGRWLGGSLRARRSHDRPG